MRRTMILSAVVAVLLAACGMPMASGTQPEPNTNQVAYWCDAGAKFEPVDTPFEIPEPPTGFVWTLLVLKAGDENSTPVVNETYDNPQPGDFYSRDDGKDISHAILCMELVPVDTTEEPPDDDTPDTTEPTDTTEPDTTSVETTEPEVTNPPCPDCTPNTQAVTTTTAPAGSTTTTAPSTTTATTVPVPAQTTTTTGPPLPITE